MSPALDVRIRPDWSLVSLAFRLMTDSALTDEADRGAEYSCLLIFTCISRISCILAAAIVDPELGFP